MNIWKIIELYIFNEWIVWCMFISIKLLSKRRREEEEEAQEEEGEEVIHSL